MAPFAETPILNMIPSSQIEVFKEPDLLDEWWTSEDLFSLERRAIFSKTWICVIHKSRFTKPGDYISFSIANIPIILIHGKDSITRAFHNVCRHRAYTITKKSSGSSLVLGCRYHGWSYNTLGSLVKAPQFDGVEGFDKTENGLFGIHTCTDRMGFVHVNLDAGRVDNAPDYEGLLGFGAQGGVEMSRWVTGWEVNGGAFNWKTVGASDRTGIGTQVSSASRMSVMGFLLSVFRRPGLDIEQYRLVYVAPATMVLAFTESSIWIMLTILPESAAKCTIRSDVYAADNSTLRPQDIETLQVFMESLIKGFELEYKSLKGTRPGGEPIQLPLLKSHLARERMVGHKIFPGRKEGRKSETFCKAEKLCNDLDHLAKSNAGKEDRENRAQTMLDW